MSYDRVVRLRFMQAPSAITVRMEAHCRDCHVENVLAKYRASASKMAIRYGSKLLVAYSGGACSRCVSSRRHAGVVNAKLGTFSCVQIGAARAQGRGIGPRSQKNGV